MNSTPSRQSLGRKKTAGEIGGEWNIHPPLCCNLPDSAGVLSDHRRVRFAVEGLFEFGHVGDRGVHPPLARRVRIYRGQHAGVSIRAVLAPSIGPSKEKALLRGQTVDWSRVFTAKGIHQGHVGDA